MGDLWFYLLVFVLAGVCIIYRIGVASRKKSGFQPRVNQDVGKPSGWSIFFWVLICWPVAVYLLWKRAAYEGVGALLQSKTMHQNTMMETK